MERGRRAWKRRRSSGLPPVSRYPGGGTRERRLLRPLPKEGRRQGLSTAPPARQSRRKEGLFAAYRARNASPRAPLGGSFLGSALLFEERRGKRGRRSRRVRPVRLHKFRGSWVSVLSLHKWRFPRRFSSIRCQKSSSLLSQRARSCTILKQVLFPR